MRKLARVGRPASRDWSSARMSDSRSSSSPSWEDAAARASSRSNCGSCQASSAATSVRSRTPARSRSVHSATVRALASPVRQVSSRSTSSASRPARSISLLPTSSSGSPRPRCRWSSPLIATPSRIRSRPIRQVLCGNRSISNAERDSASSPHRTPARDTQRLTRSRSSSVNPNRRRHGSLAARSSTSDAVTRPPDSSSSELATASSGLVLVSARSASFTRSWCAGWPSSVASPNPAEISGA